MAPCKPCQAVECKTVDGIKLKGWFFEVERLAPAIIMTNSFNCTKELNLTETAEAFQSAGYNVLLYDARSIGASGGLPRNQIDPIQNAEDLSDVISYIVTLTKVDPLRIMLWGMSLGGTISACTAVFDKRVTAVLMLCPIFNIVRPDKRQSGFVQLLKDRQSPQELLQERLEDIPVMMIIPELDDISPPEIQREVFDTFKTPKKLHVAPGKEHMSILTGKGSREVLETMLEFLDLVQLPSYRI